MKTLKEFEQEVENSKETVKSVDHYMSLPKRKYSIGLSNYNGYQYDNYATVNNSTQLYDDKLHEDIEKAIKDANKRLEERSKVLAKKYDVMTVDTRFYTCILQGLFKESFFV